MTAEAVTATEKPKRVRKAKPKGAPEGPPKGPPCANCETELVGAFCHACGQKAHLHDKLKHLVEEFAEGIAHFDGRLWRTLPLLAFNPGKLSREWMEGRRVRYVAPLHLFLFAVFLLFLLPNFTGRHMFAPPHETTAEAGHESSARPVTEPVNNGFWINNDDGTRTEIPADDAEALKEELNVHGPVAAVIDLLAKQRKNPEYYGYKIESLSYKLSFMTVPISVVLLWLMFAWRRRFSLYHHAVVALYGLGFLALLSCVVAIAPSFLSSLATFLAMIAAFTHAVVHLKGAYGSGWIQSVLRALTLGLLTTVTFGLFLFGVMLLGLSG
ncbi:DUF3667 domain-containing protein [Brevundimonas sp.]|uniref:DUF3667 domain-containing protein n=1 Tax=Brevundimonas sp. TaxID=1871086 RepID=UPI003F709613